MTRRYDILRGDLTTLGGIVQGGDANDMVGHREQAYEGDPVWCPVCKSVGQIVCIGPRLSTTGPDGREAALSDDLCVCRCSPSPLLLPSLGLALYFLWRLMPGRAVTQQQARLSSRWIPAVGVVGGAFSGFFSVGGGVVAAPALVGLFGMRQAAAQGLALALVTPGAVVALMTYAQAGHVDWTSGIPLSLGGMLTISWGVALAHRMPERRLRAAFAVCLIVTAVIMLVRG